MSPIDPQSLRGATLYFDCASGIAGDMAVGALVDLGVPESVVRGELAKLPVSGYRVAFERVLRGGLTGTKFRVLVDGEGEHAFRHGEGHEHGEEDHAHAHQDEYPHQDEQQHEAEKHADAGHTHHHANHAHVHYRSIREMLVAARITDGARRRALAMFDRIAAVEGKLHGVSVEEVAFHEVGAVDSIVDIVATSVALDWLGPARLVSRRVPLGRGSVMTSHGLLPVPAPATLELLVGVPVEDGGVETELTTPTGAAILAASVDAYGPLPPLTVIGVGWGAGDRQLPDRPNLLRVIAGTPATEAAGELLLVVEANIDDMSPELAAPLVDALLGAGARDAWLQPVLMKKGRPAFVVAALVDEAGRAAVEATLLRESTTIGVRRHFVERTVLPRRIVEVETPYGTIPVKVAGDAGDWQNAAPEFEACRRIAVATGVPLKRVYAEALAAFLRR